MHIITWNVNGLRALLRKDAWEWVNGQRAEVVCLQEIKARPDQLSAEMRAAFSGFHRAWHPAERPGYSGVATFTRSEPQEVRLGLGIPEFDVEGRVIQSWFDRFVLFNIYVPHGGRGQERLQFKLDFYCELLAYCQDLRAAGQEVILCGDFNTAHQPIDLRNPTQNKNTSGFMQVEREWIDRYLESGLVDIYRLQNPERVQYTWWTYRMNARARNVGWRLDYFLVSPGLMDWIETSTIHDQVLGSDHCPVSLQLTE